MCRCIHLLTVLFISAALFLFGSAGITSAQTASVQGAGPVLHTLEAADYEAMFKVPRTQLGKRGRPTAEIIVRYVDFPQEAQRAFQSAVDIWETHVSSSVPIYMVARWADLDERTLGSAGPTFIFNNDELTRPPFSFGSPPLPADDVWYPSALAMALTGERLTVAGRDCGAGSDSGLPAVEGECPDMIATFNSELDVDGDGDVDWSFALDPQPAQIQGEYHLATVVLHEIGHGLGFFDTFNLDDGQDDRDECPDGPVGSGCWGFAWQGTVLPVIFDIFVEDADENLLINTNVYPNPSQALGDALQSEAVFFAGEAVKRTNVDVPADLYAPRNFEPGSSTAHLDEQVFNNTPNALMTPQLARSEIILSPGPITCALFFDIGWPLGLGCEVFVQPELLAFDAMTAGGAIVVTWEVAEDVAFDRFVIERSGLADCQFERCRAEEEDLRFVPVDTVAATGQSEPYEQTIDLATLPGRYFVRLRMIRANGTTRVSEAREVIIPLEEEVVVTDVYPNPFRVSAEINLVLETSQRVEVRVYNSVGRLVARLHDSVIGANVPARIRFPADGLAAGAYFVRVDGESFTKTLDAVKL